MVEWSRALDNLDCPFWIGQSDNQNLMATSFFTQRLLSETARARTGTMRQLVGNEGLWEPQHTHLSPQYDFIWEFGDIYM